jgi:hypothetical protein
MKLNLDAKKNGLYMNQTVSFSSLKTEYVFSKSCLSNYGLLFQRTVSDNVAIKCYY